MLHPLLMLHLCQCDAQPGSNFAPGNVMAIPGNLLKLCDVSHEAIPTIETDYLLNFTTSLPFLLLLLASTQQPMFKGVLRTP
jgi:hypothetical protein